MSQRRGGMYYANSEGVPLRHPNRAKRQHFPITACRFREARLSAGMGVERCADLLRVSERTVRNWEAGKVRIPYAAYKLLRVLRGGRFLADPIWRDFRVWRDVLITPEGHKLPAGDLAWWSLLVRRARAFGELYAAGRIGAESGLPDRPELAVSIAAPQPAAPCPVDLTPAPLVASGGRKRVQKNRLPELPTSNRGVSETERIAGEAVPSPEIPCAAALPKAGAAARRSRLGAVLRVAGGGA